MVGVGGVGDDVVAGMGEEGSGDVLQGGSVIGCFGSEQNSEEVFKGGVSVLGR